MNKIHNFFRKFTWLRKSPLACTLRSTRVPFGCFGGTVAKRSSTKSFRGLWLWLLLIPLWGLGGFSCKEEGRTDYFDDSVPAPAKVDVSTVTVRNTPGGAVLKYKVPDDKNLRYVRAVYETQPGKFREAVASYFVDTLALEGFGDTRTYSVKLYSVGKNEKTSEPVTVQVNPDTPPIRLTSKTMREAFGGISITVKNPLKENIAAVLYGDTARLGYMNYLETFYTSNDYEVFKLRGLDTIACNYAVFIRDRWGYVTDTLYANLKPMYEEYIPKSGWQPAYLPGDALQSDYGRPMSEMWDNNFWDWSGLMIRLLPPVSFTIDLGRTVSMSRFKIWHMAPWEYTNSSPKRFELYGAMSTNDGIWIPLGRFELLPPSGNVKPTADDIAYAKQGIDCELEVTDFAPNPYSKFRYLRFNILENFDMGRKETSIAEIDIWGTISKNNNIIIIK